MQYNININQLEACEWGLNLQQAFLFSFLYELPSWAECHVIAGISWHRIAKSKLIKELPILTSKTDTIYRQMRGLSDVGLIEVNQQGAVTLVRITHKGASWNRDLGNKSEGSEKNPPLPGKVSASSSEKNPTYHSTILNPTTTTQQQNSPHCGGAFEAKFSQLILDEWDQWGLRQAAIQMYLEKPLSLLQDLLDKTAYEIRRREGTDRKIQTKIGFLKKNLEREFCEIDDAFVTREEKFRKQKAEQLKREAARSKEAKEAEIEAAIELFEAQLSDEEHLTIRYQAIATIKEEMKQPHMEPREAMISSFKKNILATKAKERGFY